ncbi:MAG: sugar ABC transporter permease [Chloroflexi bacterium]|nr:sugar ABC transporter permease [Chloroflexota bacterium]
MLPSLVLTAMFSLYPTVASWYFSLFDWTGINSTMYYIGVRNYVELIHDQYFWGAFGRSVVFMVTSVPLELGLSLVVAVILNDRALKLAPIYRTLFFIPVVTTTAIMSIVMSFVFSAYNGPANAALTSLHITSRPIDFLGDPHTALYTAVVIAVWKWFGQPMVYWLAGLQTIPDVLYEAARVDGAGWWRILRSITLPLLAPFGVVILLIVAVGNLQVFALIQALTNGGPFFSTETMELYIYRTAFAATPGYMGQPRLGYASAAGVVFGLCIMVLAIFQVLAFRRFRGGEARGSSRGLA